MAPRTGAAGAESGRRSLLRSGRDEPRRLWVVDPSQRRRVRWGMRFGLAFIAGAALVVVVINIMLINGQSQLDDLERRHAAARAEQRELLAQLAAVEAPAAVEDRIERDGRFVRAQDVPDVPSVPRSPATTSAPTPAPVPAPAPAPAAGRG